MKPNKIESGKIYEVAVGKNTTTVKIVKIERRINGQLVFECKNANTGKPMRIADSKRFLKEIKTEKTVTSKGAKTERTPLQRPDGTVSGLQAAYLVLKDATEPLNVRQIMERINERGLANLAGKTPGATVSAAIQREVLAKGTESRFIKTGKGFFAVRQ